MGRFWSSTCVFLLAWGCTCARTGDVLRNRANFGRDGGVEGLHSRDDHQTRVDEAPKTRCQTASAQQTIQALGDNARDDDFAAFGVEVGAPLVESDGFWVPWLSSDGSASSVGVTRVGAELLSAESIALGRVHWDAGPPRLARVSGETVLAVVPDGDANGGSYRVAAVRGGTVTWGAELEGSSDDSPAFDVAGAAGRALLVWDDYVREEARGTIRGVLLDGSGGSLRTLERVSPATTDAESPRLARHESGYWLAWLRVEWAPKTDVRGTRATQPATPKGLVDEDESALAVTRRWIEVMPLDLDGRATGEPLRVSPSDAMVQGFDLVAGHDGGLVVSWRQDFSNSGTNGGTIWTAHLSPGGSVEAFAVDAPAVGGTLPVLLFDPKPPSGVPHGWLSVEASGGDSALAALSPFGKPLEVLSGNVGLGVASVLGVLDGQLLLAKPKGRNIVLQLARCDYSPRALDADAGAPPRPVFEDSP